MPILLNCRISVPRSVISASIQPAERFFIIAGDHPELFTGVHFTAVTTGLISAWQSALPDRTERITVGRFYSVNTASDAIDHIRCDLHPVKL